MAMGQIVKLGRFHLDRQDPVAHHDLVEIGAFVVKNIGRINAAHMRGDAQSAGCLNCG